MKGANWAVGVIAVGLAMLAASQVLAQDWPQWRGPERDGKAAGFKVPETWPEALNQKWKITVGAGDASPVLVGGRLVGLAQENRGQFFCLDPATGKTLWTSEGRIGENAALVVAGGAVLALTSNAELLVIDPGADRFETLARYKVSDAPTWAHPVVIGRQILIKDHSSLALWSMGS